MIYANDITQWGVNHPWSTRDDIEQDLLLSQAICEIANDPLLGNELVIRGGTAFHKLFLQKPHRYAVKNLEKKLENRKFLDDLNGLAVVHEVEYDPIEAGSRVIEKLLCLL